MIPAGNILDHEVDIHDIHTLGGTVKTIYG